MRRWPIVGLVALCACTPNYADLFNEQNFVVPVDGTTWMRTTDEAQTHILFLEGEGAPQDADGDGRITVSLSVVESNTQTSSWLGAIEEGASDVRFERGFMFPYEYHKSTLQRAGTRVVPLDLTLPLAPTITDAGVLTVDTDAGALTFENFIDIASRPDVETQRGMEELARIFHLGAMIGQARLEFFGGTGLFNYGSSPGVFACQLGGSSTISLNVLDNNRVVVDLDECSEFAGMVVDGTMQTTSSIAGDGDIRGTVDFSMPLNDGGERRGEFRYDDAQLRGGEVRGGEYEVTLEGQDPVRIDFTVLRDMILTDTIPPSGGPDVLDLLGPIPAS